VHDGRLLAPLDLPAGVAQAVGQVGVLGRADVLAEAAHLLERRAAAGHVGRLGIAPVAEVEGVRLAHLPAQVRVALDRGRAGRRGLVEHAAANQAGAFAGRRVEVAVEQVGRRLRVGVEEDEPVGAPAGGAPVAGEGRGGDAAVRPARGVVHHLNRVVLAERQLAQPLVHAAALLRTALERDYDVHRRPHDPDRARSAGSTCSSAASSACRMQSSMSM
jgi:hypothetical protein